MWSINHSTQNNAPYDRSFKVIDNKMIISTFFTLKCRFCNHFINIYLCNLWNLPFLQYLRWLSETAPLIVFRKLPELCPLLPVWPTNVLHFSPKHISQLLVSVLRQLEILLFAWGGFLCIGSQGWRQPANIQPLFLLADLQTLRVACELRILLVSADPA